MTTTTNPVDTAAVHAYVTDLLALCEQINTLRATHMPHGPAATPPSFGYRSVIDDIDTVTHLASRIDDGTLTSLTLADALTRMITDRATPCTSGGDDHLWEWQSDQVSDWLARTYPELSDCCGAYTTHLDAGDGTWVECCRACKDEITR